MREMKDSRVEWVGKIPSDWNGRKVKNVAQFINGDRGVNYPSGEDLVDDHTAYLTAFRTIEEYQGQGYFSKLFKFMINDLKSRGYTRVTLGVEPTELTNKAIYTKYGFTNFIKTAIEEYPDGTKTDVEYYYKDI